MKNCTLFLAGIVISMAACKKNNPAINAPSPAKAETDKPLVSFSRTLSNSDTYQAAFSYNAMGSLTKLVTAGVESGNPISSHLYVRRNDNNIIMVSQSAATSAQFAYDTSARHYVYALITDSQHATTDSICYLYSGDNITVRIIYNKAPTATQYHLLHTTTFDYSASGNIMTITEYKIVPGRAVEVERSAFTYDQAVNPLPLYDENIILGLERTLPAGKNNWLTATEDLGSATGTYTATSDYTYSTIKKPLSGKVTATDGTTAVLMYQY